MKLTRRDFLRAGVAAGAASLLWRPRFGLAAAPTAQELARTIAAVEGSDPARMVRRAFDLLGGIERFVKRGMRVVVKPNASFANPAEWGNNTNPEVVAAVCKLAIEVGARKVSVVDYPLMRGAEALKLNGIAAACAGLAGVSLNVLGSQDQFRQVKVPGGVALKQVEVSREVLDADLVINVPVAKAHDAVAASIGLKNLMGVIWDRTAFHTQLEINQAIADLVRVVRPQLTLVDLTRVMTTNGPKGPGEIETPNLVVAGTDPLAVDSFALGLARFNGRRLRPRQLKYLALASDAGLGEVDPGKLVVRKETA